MSINTAFASCAFNQSTHEMLRDYVLSLSILALKLSSKD